MARDMISEHDQFAVRMAQFAAVDVDIAGSPIRHYHY